MDRKQDKRLCISYLDEANAYDNIPNVSFTSIVSITALKSTYISGLETSWKELRKKYNVKQGIYLHFNKIKNLINHNSNIKCDDEIKRIFSDETGNISYKILHDFYSDILKIIKNNNFVVQSTGIFTLRKCEALPKFIGTNSLMYQLFREHLDRIAFYLVDLMCKDLEERRKNLTKKRNNPEKKWYKSKLRYDGDEKLDYHNDLRNAFSHCLVDGTKHFNSDASKNLFENLKFVSKNEVASCTNCSTNCNYEIISHAGHEVVDFIALYVARDMWKHEYKDYILNNNNNNKTENEIDDLIKNLSTINIPGFNLIDPMEYIRPRLFQNKNISGYKKIKDFPF